MAGSAINGRHALQAQALGKISAPVINGRPAAGRPLNNSVRCRERLGALSSRIKLAALGLSMSADTTADRLLVKLDAHVLEIWSGLGH